jgi:DNA-binding transcriptional LysR family regulator
VDVNELRALLAVVETGSFLAAANQLGWPRATLRRRIDEIEARAGTALLVRTRQGAAPTPAGAVLAARAEAVLEEASALLRSVRELASEASGSLRVVVPVGLPPKPVSQLLAMLRAQLPGLSWRIRASNDPFSERLEEVDIAVHFGWPRARSRWTTYRVMEVREWLVAAPSYLRRRGRPTAIEHLHGHDLLMWERPGRSCSHWPTLSGLELPVEPLVVHSDIHALRYMAAAGHGIALVPDAEVDDPELASGALETVLADEIGAIVALCVSVPTVVSDVPRVRAVLELVREFAATL